MAGAALATGWPTGTGGEEGLGAGAIKPLVPERPLSRLKPSGAGDGQHRAAAQLLADHPGGLDVHAVLADAGPGSAPLHLQPPGAGAITADQPGKPCREKHGGRWRGMCRDRCVCVCVRPPPPAGSYLGR